MQPQSNTLWAQEMGTWHQEAMHAKWHLISSTWTLFGVGVLNFPVNGEKRLFLISCTWIHMKKTRQYCCVGTVLFIPTESSWKKRNRRAMPWETADTWLRYNASTAAGCLLVGFKEQSSPTSPVLTSAQSQTSSGDSPRADGAALW